ncbi:MAG: hypothetical protein JO353_04665 [Phycisphaerae bacterium]|nr:hypothetical protein [Phycisphaerae bacterium]
MISRTSADLRRDFASLPSTVQRQAREAYQLFKANPQHSSLRFKELSGYQDIWSVRITTDYRAIGRLRAGVIVWFFIGSHADYDKIIARI